MDCLNESEHSGVSPPWSSLTLLSLCCLCSFIRITHTMQKHRNCAETEPWVMIFRCSINTKNIYFLSIRWLSKNLSVTLPILKAPANCLILSHLAQTENRKVWLTCCLAAFRVQYLQANTQLGSSQTMWASNTICANATIQRLPHNRATHSMRASFTKIGP